MTIDNICLIFAAIVGLAILVFHMGKCVIEIIKTHRNLKEMHGSTDYDDEDVEDFLRERDK